MIGERVMRSVLISMSHSRSMASFMTNSPLVWRAAASRFVSGQTMDEGLAVVKDLNAHNMTATLDHLGESVTTVQQAAASAKVYLNLAEHIRQAGVHSGMSVKLTAIGLDISTDLATELMKDILAHAAAQNPPVFARIDMEGSPHTQRTLDVFERCWADYKNTGVVFQSMLYRTAADVERIIELGASVRMVKGAYKEPPSIAWPTKAEVDTAFLRLTERLMSPEALANGVYTAVATHDTAILDWTKAFAEQNGVPRDRFEFQLLYGVRRDLQQSLAAEGYRMRVYVPFGTQWYPYYMRRLAERPENVGFMIRHTLAEIGK